jgi:hypothetical protein
MVVPGSSLRGLPHALHTKPLPLARTAAIAWQ